MKSLFNLNNDEITKVDSSIECFWSNNMITKIKRIEKVSKIVGSFFKIIIITTVKQIIYYFIEKLLIKIGLGKVALTIVILLI